jgi:hypothetical protein
MGWYLKKLLRKWHSDDLLSGVGQLDLFVSHFINDFKIVQ